MLLLQAWYSLRILYYYYNRVYCPIREDFQQFSSGDDVTLNSIKIQITTAQLGTFWPFHMNIVCIVSTNHLHSSNPPETFFSKNENMWTNVYVVFRGVGVRVPPRGSSQELAARRHRQAGVTLAAGRAVPHYQSSAQERLLSSVGGRRHCHHGAADEADVRSGIWLAAVWLARYSLIHRLIADWLIVPLVRFAPCK